MEKVTRTSMWQSFLAGFAWVVVGTLAGASDRDADSSAGMAGPEALYAKHCVLCHGTDGAADGPAAELLFPPARDFTGAKFKLTSTVNAVPTEADLVAVLKRGVPGSAMPAWSWMAEAELRGLVGHVRSLAVEGRAAALQDADGIDAAQALERANAELTPGAPVDIVADLVVDADVLKRGAELYRDACASCHGTDGRGRHDVVQRDDDETRNRARDFTAGLLKGGASRADLARRIQVGLHGTSMPSNAFSRDDIGALVAHLRTLIPEDSENRLVQKREVLRATRLPAPVPRNPRHRMWQSARNVDLVLAPLWWDDDAILHAEVAALHDGETLALRIRWDDATADAPQSPRPPYDLPPYADAVALQLVEHGKAPQSPAFGMATADERANIWFWRADAFLGLKSLADLGEFVLHGPGRWSDGNSVSDLPVVRAAPGPMWIAGEAQAVQPEGMHRLAEQTELDAVVESSPRWMDGVWEVVLTREMEPGTTGEVALRPGSSAWFSLAIWNGAIRDLRGKKSATIWHELEIDE